MRILQNFDQSIATVLGEKVKARMTFKVRALRLDLGIGTNADTLL
jgi:transcription initiation factor TFIIA small subunit